MDDTHIDPAVFKAQQREQWSNVAQGWRRGWAAFEQGAQPLSDRMMILAHVAPGQRVLDVATGIGEPAMTAARHVGPSGSVVVIDQAPQMLAVACERMQAAGIRTVEFVEGDAEAVTLPLDSFDAVVCRWGSCSSTIQWVRSHASGTVSFQEVGSQPQFGVHRSGCRTPNFRGTPK